MVLTDRIGFTKTGLLKNSPTAFFVLPKLKGNEREVINRGCPKMKSVASNVSIKGIFWKGIEDIPVPISYPFHSAIIFVPLKIGVAKLANGSNEPLFPIV
jgi:hypothetical protein